MTEGTQVTLASVQAIRSPVSFDGPVLPLPLPEEEGYWSSTSFDIQRSPSDTSQPRQTLHVSTGIPLPRIESFSMQVVCGVPELGAVERFLKSDGTRWFTMDLMHDGRLKVFVARLTGLDYVVELIGGDLCRLSLRVEGYPAAADQRITVASIQTIITAEDQRTTVCSIQPIYNSAADQRVTACSVRSIYNSHADQRVTVVSVHAIYSTSDYT